MRKVDRCEGRATLEHCRHILHIFSIERRYVERCKFFTIAEHPTHIRHILSIQIGDTFDVSKVLATFKPAIASCRSCPGKGRVEHHLLDVLFIAHPAWEGRSGIHQVSVGRLAVVILECERAVGRIEHGIRFGLGSLRHQCGAPERQANQCCQ